MLTTIDAGVGIKSMYSPGSIGVAPGAGGETPEPSPPMLVAGWDVRHPRLMVSPGMQISWPAPATTASDRTLLENPKPVSDEEFSETSADTKAAACVLRVDKISKTRKRV